MTGFERGLRDRGTQKRGLRGRGTQRRGLRDRGTQKRGLRGRGTQNVVVVGGGISGLAAAYELTRGDPAPDVTLLEASDRIGGKIATGPVAGVAVDQGADAFLARVPDAVELCEELGIADELVAPRTTNAYVWWDGALRRLPEGTVLGVPVDADASAGSDLLSADELAQAVAAVDRRRLPRWGRDPSVGAFARSVAGRAAAERMVGPLVGGINAGDPERLSLRAVTPQLAGAAVGGGRVGKALRAQRQAADPTAPVFLAPEAGMQRLVDALEAHLTGVDVQRNTRASSVQPADTGGWLVWASPEGESSQPIQADAVVLAPPAPVASELLADAAPTAARLLAGVEYASVAIVTFAFAPEDVAYPPDASGFLVPRSAGLLLTACSWTSAKWGHAEGPAVLRVSAGRDGDERALELGDDELVDELRADLKTTMGTSADPVEVRIDRWPHSFPQYRPGHLRRVARIERILRRAAPGVVVTGAAQRGLGVPACIHQGRAAARSVL